MAAIRNGTLLVVTDGSYIKEMHPELCSATFVLECSQTETGGRMIGSFPELSPDACAYPGKMLGLLALHLILLAVNKLHPELDGQVALYSDCLGALSRVATVPASRIPSSTKHADILKIIMIHCQQFPFDISYRHVRAHQDDKLRYRTKGALGYYGRQLPSTPRDAHSGVNGCICREMENHIRPWENYTFLVCTQG